MLFLSPQSHLTSPSIKPLVLKRKTHFLKRKLCEHESSLSHWDLESFPVILRKITNKRITQNYNEGPRFWKKNTVKDICTAMLKLISSLTTVRHQHARHGNQKSYSKTLSFSFWAHGKIAFPVLQNSRMTRESAAAANKIWAEGLSGWKHLLRSYDNFSLSP